MRITEIENVQQMMARLLLTEDLDKYLLVSAVFNTRSRTEIDGAINEAFFDDDEKEALGGRKNVYWGEVRPVAKELIRGKKVPVSLRIVLMKETDTADKYIMTFSYKDRRLSLVTAMNHETFTMDREQEKAWDEEAAKLLDIWTGSDPGGER